MRPGLLKEFMIGSIQVNTKLCGVLACDLKVSVAYRISFKVQHKIVEYAPMGNVPVSFINTAVLTYQLSSVVKWLLIYFCK